MKPRSDDGSNPKRQFIADRWRGIWACAAATLTLLGVLASGASQIVVVNIRAPAASDYITMIGLNVHARGSDGLPITGGIAGLDIVALSGIYGKILNYVMSVDTVFFALSAACLFVFRRRDGRTSFRVPWHPLTTLVFIIAESFVALSVVVNYPLDSAKGWAILLAGIPIYFLWRRKK